ncbi:MAG: aminotransferase class V-fold PLP-dependent enzyme [Candidatus Asgardarchaeia archaeon]
MGELDVKIRRVINACGSMTALGSSVIRESGIREMMKASRVFVVMDELYSEASRVLSELTGAEAGCVTTGAAAGIAISVAACIAGRDIRKIEKLPDSDGMKNRVIIPKAHCINFGAPITQMIRLGGGIPVEVGQVNTLREEHVRESIDGMTAAMVYVVSHHCPQKGIISLKDFLKIGKEENLPVIVDAAAEFDILKYVRMGIDLMVFSGGKAIRGPGASGMILGRKDLIEACWAQYKGIGRAMKVGKEEIFALLASLKEYMSEGSNELKEQMKRIEIVRRNLDGLDGVDLDVERDEAGRPIYRLFIKIDEDKLNIRASEIFNKLMSGNPAIVTRPHHLKSGIIVIDPRFISEEDAEFIAEKMKSLIYSER